MSRLKMGNCCTIIFVTSLFVILMTSQHLDDVTTLVDDVITLVDDVTTLVDDVITLVDDVTTHRGHCTNIII